MPEADPNKIIAFETAEKLAKWLKENHAKEQELWIKIFKVNSNMASVTWDDVVIESLCWGWIDGIKKSIDDLAYLQRITPRKAKSVWSKRNRKHVERLLNDGRMMESGLCHVRAAQADGRWENAYAVSEMTVPEDFINALKNNANAQSCFEKLTKSYKLIIARGLTSAKRPETRQKRFTQYIAQLEQNKKPT